MTLPHTPAVSAKNLENPLLLESLRSGMTVCFSCVPRFCQKHPPQFGKNETPANRMARIEPVGARFSGRIVPIIENRCSYGEFFAR
jgi:hypothetical protein